MKLESMKNEFPKMPEEIEKMVTDEVGKQMQYRTHGLNRKWYVSKTAAAAVLLAFLTVGTTVYAAVRYYQMTADKVGEYGVETNISLMESEEIGQNEQYAAQIEVPKVVCEVGYVPEGMIKFEEQKYGYVDNGNNSGLSFLFYAMDMGDDAFEMADVNIAHQETRKIAGKDAIYLENVTQKEGEEPFKKMYVFFSEEHYVMELFISKEVSKEEAIKFAEGITLRPATAEDEKKDIVSDYVWSEHIASAEENEQISDDWYSIDKDDFCTREIGEKLEVGTLTACVEQVEVFDNINMLLPAYVDYNMLYEMGIVDKDGVLLDATKEYYKRGDGIHTVDEWIKTETAPLKLVYVTVSYANNGEEDLEEVIFGGSLLHTVDEGEKLTVWNHKYTDGENEFIDLGYGGYYKEIMLYYDVHGGEKNNNYIPCIKAGETVTVHMGFLVLEEMLPHMYLNLDTYSGGLEFSESALKIGYVDIRQ